MQRRRILGTLGLATTTALLAALGVGGAVSTAAAAPISVSTVDFEDGTTGAWTQSGGGAGTIAVVDGPDGGKVLRVNDRAQDYVGIQSPTGILEPGTTYDFSMRARLAEGTPGSAGVRFVVKPAYSWVGNTTMTADAWTTVTGSFTTPADGDPATLQVYLGTGALTPDAAYSYLVDDISITTEAGPAPIP